MKKELLKKELLLEKQNSLLRTATHDFARQPRFRVFLPTARSCPQNTPGSNARSNDRSAEA